MSKDVQFNLRIPAELKAKIEDAAKTNNRSINAEAMNRLEQSFIEENLSTSITHKFSDPDFTRRLERSFNLLSEIEGLIESTNEDEKVITVKIKKKISSRE